MQVFLYNISNYTEKENHLVTPKRLERAEKYYHKEDRVRCIASGILLAKYLGVKEDSQLCYGENGKPKLSDKSRGKHFNLSHSGKYVALAIANSDVGIDIEKIGSFSRRVAEKCFTSKENSWLVKQNNDTAFYKLWTGKESVMKGTGLGFKLAPSSFCVRPNTNNVSRVQNDSWYLNWWEYDGYVLCFALKEKSEPIEVFMDEKRIYKNARKTSNKI